MVVIVQPLMIKFFTMGKVTQDILDEYHTFGEWTLSIRFAEGLVCICCVIIYASGFPFLYFIGASYCFCAYWVDKYVLLRGSRVPPAYTKDAILPGLRLIPYAVLFGLAFSLWLYGQQELYPSDWSDMFGFAEAFVGINKDGYQRITGKFKHVGLTNQEALFRDYVKCRFLDIARQGCKPCLILFIFMSSFYILKLIYLLLLRPFIGAWLDNKYVIHVVPVLENTFKLDLTSHDTTETWHQAKARIDADDIHHHIFSYKMAANPRYEDVMDALKFSMDESLHDQLGQMEEIKD